MKKRYLALGLVVLAASTGLGCGGDNGGGGFDKDRLTVIEGLAEDRYPNLERMDAEGVQLAGRVDVDIVFGKTKPGWEAVEAAYEKIQPGVDVRLNEHSDSTYVNDVTNQVNSLNNTDWDIFQGNRVGTRINSSAINLNSVLYDENHYAGKEVDDPDVEENSSKMWQSVLSRDAYITDKSGSNTACYIMNSESLSTAWFVNKTALEAAGKQGYLNADAKVDVPKTWDDLMNLCEAMVKAGYSHPLGLAGDSASINDSQFAWIFRIYGDQYYRDMYPQINVQEGDKLYPATGAPAFNFKLDDPQPESNQGYNPSHTRFWNSLLDESETYGAEFGIDYVGANSEKFACFLENLYRIKAYLPTDFSQLGFQDVEDAFMSASSKSAPAILLDYTGFGLTFGTEDRGFEIDFFDYPAMECNHADKHVTTDFVRDVGGNGGYLSVMKHADEAQNALNVDFLKFFMSPYGQSIYYLALQSAKIAPDGLSTVLDFAVPESWKTFFESDKIAFNGLCDINWYNNNFLYHVNGQSDSREAHVSTVLNMFTGKATSAADAVAAFQRDWDEAVRKGYNKLCEDMKWSKEMWKSPGTSPII